MYGCGNGAGDAVSYTHLDVYKRQQEMKPYFTDFPNVKNNCLRFEVSPSIEESSSFTDTDWTELGNDFMQKIGRAHV